MEALFKEENQSKIMDCNAFAKDLKLDCKDSWKLYCYVGAFKNGKTSFQFEPKPAEIDRDTMKGELKLYFDE